MNPPPPRAARAPHLPLVVPPWPASGARAPIGADATAAAYGAHIGDQHDGRRGPRCPTCRAYIAGLAAALDRERAQP